MNALAANDIEAADLLARLDGDGSLGRCGPAMVMPRPPRTDMIATAQEPKDQRPLPETTGGHSAVARSLGHPVTASRAEMIAAASGHARQQLTPALTGVG